MAANGGTIYARGATPGGPVHAIWQNFERRVWCVRRRRRRHAARPLTASTTAAQVAAQPISTIPTAAAAQDQEGRDARRPARRRPPLRPERAGLGVRRRAGGRPRFCEPRLHEEHASALSVRKAADRLERHSRCRCGHRRRPARPPPAAAAAALTARLSPASQRARPPRWVCPASPTFLGTRCDRWS